MALLHVIFIFFISMFPGYSCTYSSELDNLEILVDNSPPFNYVLNGEATGISVDLMLQMLKIVGSSQSVKDMKFLPWARQYSMVERNKNTVLFMMTRTKERESKFKWVGPIAKNSIVLISKKINKVKIKNYKDINKYIIGTVREDVSEQLMLSNGVSIHHLARSAKIKSSIEKLRRGRVHLVAYDKTITQWVLKELGENLSEYEVAFTLNESHGYFAFNKETSSELISKFQDALDELKKNGKYNQVLEKYSD